MKNRIIIIGLLVFTFRLQAEKLLIEAGQPSIEKASQSTANQLVLAVGAFDPLYEKLDFSKSAISDVASSKYKIVQFFEGKADSQWLKNHGINIISYMPNNAFVIVSNAKTNGILDKNSDIRWYGNYSSGYKISPELWINNSNKINNESFDLMVTLFKDYPNNKISSLITKYLPDAIIKQKVTGQFNQIVLKVNFKNLEETLNKLSLIDNVRYVELVKPMKFTNTEAVTATQANANPGAPVDNSYTPRFTPIWDKGLLGTGQIIGIADSGLDSNED